MAEANIQRRIDHLKNVGLLQDLKENAQALSELAMGMIEKKFYPGGAIITEGETGSEMFLLIKGQASVYKSTPEGDFYKVAILSGDHSACFGEGGLLGSDARSATIRADSACECLVLDRKAFEAFGKQYPQWALPVVYRITHAMMSRLKKANNDLMLLYKALVAEIRGN